MAIEQSPIQYSAEQQAEHNRREAAAAKVNAPIAAAGPVTQVMPTTPTVTEEPVTAKIEAAPAPKLETAAAHPKEKAARE